jgi:hypothetical protein
LLFLDVDYNIRLNMMKKWIVLLFILSMILKLNAQTGIAITVIVAPAPGAAITMDS